jgi:hypothetical protein
MLGNSTAQAFRRVRRSSKFEGAIERRQKALSRRAAERG